MLHPHSSRDGLQQHPLLFLSVTESLPQWEETGINGPCLDNSSPGSATSVLYAISPTISRKTERIFLPIPAPFQPLFGFCSLGFIAWLRGSPAEVTHENIPENIFALIHGEGEN